MPADLFVQQNPITKNQSCDSRPLRKYAMVFSGGVGRIERSSTGDVSHAFEYGHPINMAIVARAYEANLFQEHADEWDVIVHSWSWDLEAKFEELYNPVAMKLEANGPHHEEIVNHGGVPCGGKGSLFWCPFGAVSASLSRKIALGLLFEREEQCAGTYHKIIVTRPDIITWKKFQIYDDQVMYPISRITANHHDDDGTGDFHWVMNSSLARTFSQGFDSLTIGSPVYFGWVRDFIKERTGMPPAVDDITPPVDQEVYRKVTTIPPAKVLEVLKPYGFNQTELDKLKLGYKR